MHWANWTGKENNGYNSKGTVKHNTGNPSSKTEGPFTECAFESFLFHSGSSKNLICDCVLLLLISFLLLLLYVSDWKTLKNIRTQPF